MKLLLIMAIEVHAKKVRSMLQNNGVSVYSETDIHGFNAEKYKPDISSWFATDGHKRLSKLFFSIQDEATVTKVLEAVKEYNNSNPECENYPLHAFQLNVEAAV